MEIEYLGHSSFALKAKSGMVAVIDPFDPAMVGLSYEKQKADIVVCSHDHKDHSAVEMITGPIKRTETFVIEAEGEYEIGGIAITSLKFNHDSKDGVERGKTLVNVFRIDGVNIAHLGDLGHSLSESQVEKLGPVDVLMVPVGGEVTLAPEDVEKVVEAISPSYVIPMHYKVSGMSESFDKLMTLDEALAKVKWTKVGESVHKLKVDESSLPEEMQVVVMNV